MDWTEVLGFVTGLITVWLAVVGRVETFPVGIINNAFFLVLFIRAGLYADAGLQVVYAALSALGWWAWLRLGPRRTALAVTGASTALLIATAAGVALATAALVPVLRAAHGSAPFLDALTTSMSLGAQALLSLKKLENWVLWMAVDLVYIPLYASRGLHLTALVYAVFLVMCVVGLRGWRRARLVPA
jgi:nicotinamide mononucleotide transporter